MPLLLLLLFVVVPLVELAVILRVGAVIGPLWTVALLLADSLFGAWLVRREGRRAWQAFREALADARWPAREVAEGALVLVGGALLLTPGFVTDLAGLLLVLPPTRRAVARFLEGRMVPMPLRAVGAQAFRGRKPAQASDRDVLDVEVVHIEREPWSSVEPDELDDGPEDGSSDPGRAAR